MRFIDFFSGIGGFRLGMEMAGHECVGHCEIDQYANKSYIAMHRPKESEWYAGDIRTVKPDELPEAECYCFGFPCQAFSIAGARRGFDDTRGTLIFEILRLTKERRPRYLFAENVSGLLNHMGGDTFATIIRAMQDLGYCVEWQVLNSRYFGVPQNRERIFIVGHLGDRCSEPVFPLATDDRQATKLQTDESIVSPTLCARKRDSGGIYPMIGGGYDQGNRLSQKGLTIGYKREGKITNVSHTLCARDYKGMSNQGLTTVMIEDEE